MDTLNYGSLEYYPVKLADRLNNLTDLDTIVCQYKVEDENEEIKVDWSTATTDGMIILPLLDTAVIGKGNWRLFVRLNIAPESPIVGPFEFGIG